MLCEQTKTGEDGVLTEYLLVECIVDTNWTKLEPSPFMVNIYPEMGRASI